MGTSTSSGAKPTVLFVHGAWADNSGFDGSIRTLRDQGYAAIGAANPLRELRSDAAYRRRASGDDRRTDRPGRSFLRRRGYLQRRYRQ